MKTFNVHYKITRVNSIVADSAYYARVEQENILRAEGYKKDDFEVVLVEEENGNQTT